jgi:8-oxo-dGTP pyrophosphatase MutT (NUDIX family)
METTRHFTASLYLVNEGAVALHEHDRLGARVPPGGHVARGELPHETALREAREETGLDPTLVTDAGADRLDPPAGRELPRPRRQVCYEVNACDGEVGHVHVDHVYYATVERRAFDPAPGELGPEAWAWYDPPALRSSGLDADVRELGLDAIATVGAE